MFRPLATAKVPTGATKAANTTPAALNASIVRRPVVAATKHTSTTGAVPARIPIHLRGAKPTPPTPPHPLEAEITTEEAKLADTKQLIEQANVDAFRCYENMWHALEDHEAQLRRDKRDRDERTESNRERIAHAQRRLESAKETLQEERAATATVQQTLDEALMLLRQTEADRLSVERDTRERAGTIAALQDACSHSETCFNELRAELQICKQKKIDHINSLDHVKDQVRKHQAEEKGAMSALKARKANIHDLNTKIDAIRRAGGGNHNTSIGGPPRPHR